MVLNKKLRKPTTQELNLLRSLVKKSSFTIQKDWEKNLLVSLMNDSEMGSLYLFPNGTVDTNVAFGQQVSDLQFIDVDGVTVIVSLNIDNTGNLFELDIWKTDFSKLIKY
jgi:hypothetical protein